MHPLYGKTNFGIHGPLVYYYNTATTSMTNGYIVKQTGTNKYVVTDGVHGNQTVTLAQNQTQITNLGSTQPTIATMYAYAPLSGATGATFTPSYALDNVTSGVNTIVSGGAGTGSSPVTFSIDGGVRATGTITITNNATLGTSNIVVGGTTITFGSTVTVGANANATATAIQAYLAGGTPNNIYSYAIGNVVYMYARLTTTAGSSIVLTTTAAGVTVSGSGTFSPNTAAIAGTPSTISVNYTSGAPTGIASVSAQGAWASLPSPANSVLGYAAAYGFQPLTLSLAWMLPTGTSTITASGGSGYAVNDYLTFSGMTDVGSPIAYVSAVSGSAASTVTVSTAGTGITAAAASIGVQGNVEHVKSLLDSTLQTVEGHKYSWHIGTPFGASAVVPKFS